MLKATFVLLMSVLAMVSPTGGAARRNAKINAGLSGMSGKGGGYDGKGRGC